MTMREAKFRGFSNDSGKWHFGHGHFLIQHTEDSGLEDYSVLHTDGSPVYVVPESIGEFTGLKDKDGVEIYEGDVLEDFINLKRYEVIWDNYGMFLFNPVGTEGSGIDYYDFEDEASSATIIVGTIYEQPHLLGDSK